MCLTLSSSFLSHSEFGIRVRQQRLFTFLNLFFFFFFFTLDFFIVLCLSVCLCLCSPLLCTLIGSIWLMRVARQGQSPSADWTTQLKWKKGRENNRREEADRERKHWPERAAKDNKNIIINEQKCTQRGKQRRLRVDCFTPSFLLLPLLQDKKL